MARAAVFAGVLSMVFAAQAIPVDEPYLADSRELIDVPASLPGICTMGGVWAASRGRTGRVSRTWPCARA